MVDLPGHGAQAAEPFTIDAAVSAISRGVAEREPGERVVLVGHSLGGYLALAYAARHAGSIDGLVLADCSAAPTGLGAALYRGVAALTDRLGPRRMTQVNDRVLRRLYPAELIEPVIEGGYFFDPTPQAWRAVMDHCRPQLLDAVSCPVLVLNGRWDQFRIGTRAFVGARPGIRVQTIPGASHLAPLDQPGRFAAAVRQFCAEADVQDNGRL